MDKETTEQEEVTAAIVHEPTQAQLDNARMRQEWLDASYDLKVALENGDEAGEFLAAARRDAIQNEFIEANYKLAMSAAKEFLRHAVGENRKDHEQSALMALWESFAGTKKNVLDYIHLDDDGKVCSSVGWDPAKGTFGTFSRLHVSGKVRRSVASQEAEMSYPNWSKRPAILAARTRLLDELDREPTHKEIAAAADVRVSAVDAVLRPSTLSLNSPMSDDGMTLEDSLASAMSAESSLSAEDSALLEEAIVAAAADAKPMDVFAFVLRNGVAGRPPLSVVETAARLGIGRGMVTPAAQRMMQDTVDKATSALK